jgi:hypothetical protein
MIDTLWHHQCVLILGPKRATYTEARN